MSWTALHAIVHQTLRQRKLLSKGQSIALAFSAGQDSMCLLQILRDLQPKWGWRLAIAHCNHRWPLDSDANAAHVAQLAEDWNLEHYSFTAPRRLKGEAEGRDWRYEVLKDWAEVEGFSAILTAHTASDRAETLLYNLLRGSGMDGLQALAWQRPLSERVRLLRPLLGIARQQTGEFCTQHQLPVWEDAMNQDLAYRRNQIRLALLPLLRQQFNPQIETTLARTAELLQAETDYLDRSAQQVLERATVSSANLPTALATLDRPVLQQTHLALQRRILRLWLHRHLNIQPNFEQIEKVLRLVDGNNGDRTDPLVADIIAEVRHPWLCLRHLDSSAHP
ncbi:tRNA lysidine(34) synthetase TilS [Altericista sp. CCNU0014]|uniref:tRNA lysidine(34) synthetase TilS n=1 Tax=Altericista sp. CCNU0014 TaxID=3082949 RepID=UPI00384BB57B